MKTLLQKKSRKSGDFPGYSVFAQKHVTNNGNNWPNMTRKIQKFVLSPWEIEIVLENDLLRLSTLHLLLR